VRGAKRKLPLVASRSYVDVREHTALLTLGSQGVRVAIVGLIARRGELGACR
jgi:hypothetical protein